MFKKFISYYKPYKKIFFLDMLASLFISLIGMLYPIFTNRILKDYIPNKNIRLIIIFGVGLLVFYLIRMYLKYYVQYKGHVMGVNMQADMRRDMFNKLQRLPFSYYDEHETGKIMSRMTNDLQNISELAHHGPENVFICGATVIFSFIYLMIINWKLTLIVFAVVPLMVFISVFMRNKMRKAFLETRKSIAIINSSLESSITGIRVTKAFNKKDEELRKFEIGNKEFVKYKSLAYKSMGEFGASTNFVTDLFNVVVLVFGAILVYNATAQGDYSSTKEYADLATFMVSIGVFITPLTSLINFVEQYQEGVTGFIRFMEIMDEDEEKENSNAKDYELEGNIEFNHVFFDYQTKQNILNDVSFKVNKGKVIALVGPSGGGKTTICHLLPNFYKVTKGEILIDGHNVNDITFKSLRESIGIVQQDVFLFNGSIKENIRYGKLDATDEEVIEAAKKANIHESIISLENGYDTQIGERGIKLSGGQKQRLSIARVFLKNPQILILDEATSALDNVTESYIQKALNELTIGRTTIVVAHRLSTIKHADEIYVISRGMVKEHGTHNELMELNGEYAHLYNEQFRLM